MKKFVPLLVWILVVQQVAFPLQQAFAENSELQPSKWKLANSPFATQFGTSKADAVPGRSASDEAFQEFSRRYEKIRYEYQVTTGAIETIGGIHNGAIVAGGAFYGAVALGAGAATVATGGVAAPVTLAMVTWASTEAVNKGVQVFKDRAAELRLDRLKTSIEIYRQKNRDDKLESLKSLSAEQAFAKINDLSPLYNDLPEGAATEDQIQLQRAQMQMLGDSVVLNAIQSQGQAKRIAASVESLQQKNHEIDSEMQNLHKTLVEVESQNQQNLLQLQSHQSELVRQAQALAEHDTAFVQGLLFGKLSPAEQVAALNEPRFLKDLSADARQEMADKAKFAATCLSIQQTTADILNVGTGLLQVGQKFKVNPKVLKTASDVMKYGGAAVNLGLAIATMNPMAALSAVFSVFGSDATQQRHEQIMSALGEIMKTQQALLEGQQRIMESQARILEQIRQLAIQMQINHGQVVEKLSGIHNDVLNNRVLLSDILSRDMQACEAFVSHRKAAPAGASKEKIYEQMVAEAKRDDNFMSCQNGLREIFSAGLENSSALRRFATSTYLHSPSEFETKVFQPLVEFVKLESQQAKNPLTIYRQLVGKKNNPKAEAFAQMISKTNRSDRLPLETYLSPEVVQWATSLLLNLHYYYVFQQPERPHHFLNITNLQEDREINLTGYQYLQHALEIVDLAIAQQQLLSGGPLLKRMAKRWDWQANLVGIEFASSADFSTGSAKVNIGQTAMNSSSNSLLKAMRSNLLLAQNVLIASFHEYLPKGTATILDHQAMRKDWMQEMLRQYSEVPVVIAERSLTGAESSLGVEVAGGIEPNGTILPNFIVPLPESKRVEEMQWTPTQDLEMLVRLRAEVVDALANYEFGADEQWKQFMSATSSVIPATAHPESGPHQ